MNKTGKDKIVALYQTLFQYHDYTTSLIMTGLSLAALDGMDIFVAHGNNVFSLDASPWCQDIVGYYSNLKNIIVISTPDSATYAARTFIHEGIHALLYKMDEKTAHNGKPYPHGNKEQKAGYIHAVEESRAITNKDKAYDASRERSFVKRTVFSEVDDSPLYSKYSSKLKEYIARAGEIHLYGLQFPGFKKEADSALGPLLDKTFRQDFIAMLERHIITHPKVSRLILPHHVSVGLQRATKAQGAAQGATL